MTMTMIKTQILTIILALTLTLTTAFPTNQTSVNLSASPVPFGAVLDHCTVPGTVALTFDDGPYMFTPALLDLLSANNAPSTFFLNGAGLGGINNYPDVVRRIWAEGHQLASHTYVPASPISQPKAY